MKKARISPVACPGYRVAELRIKQPCDCISHKDNKVVVKCVTIEGSELAGSRNFLRW